MNFNRVRKVLPVLFFLLPGTLFAQNLTGIWRGTFVTDDFSQYKFELQIKQKDNIISGVSYSYRTTVFYGKATLTGSFSKSAQSALIREIKTVELRMAGGSACIMKCMFEYSRSGEEEFLEGTFTSIFEKDSQGGKKGDDCGGGKVRLRKVTTSDFYVEPFLRKDPPAPKPAEKKPPVVQQKTTTQPKTQTKPPVVKKPVETPKTNPVTKTDTKKDVIIDNKDSVAKVPPVAKVNIPVVPRPEILKTRTNELVKTITVTEENILIKLFDNGEIDDDTISVYLDNQLILSKKKLTATALIIRIKMDESNPEHELVMVAENLGRIPPNTSLMIVESGTQRYEARITSNEQKNAVVRFRYVKN